MAAGKPPVAAGRTRHPLPPSEKGASGNYWLAAFVAGITGATKRPYTAGQKEIETLERIVASEHAPFRDAPRACAWFKEQAGEFARKWDGEWPSGGLTPKGFEQWLNAGRRGPPEFRKKRIVQGAATERTEDKQRTEDNLRKNGAEVVR